MINKSLINTTNEIVNKKLLVSSIFKTNKRIEIVSKNPTAFTTIIYKNNQDRDSDYMELDNKIFHLVKL